MPALEAQPRSAARGWPAFTAVLLFAALVIGLPAGRAPLWDPNEARYMLLARDILENGRWLIPDLRGEPYLNKPQLYFWAVALASLPRGEVTEWSGALPAVISSVATVAAVFTIAVRAWGWRAGALAALALTTSVGFFLIGHHGQPDVMVMAWTWWALAGLLRARAAGWRLAPLAGFYACVAGAVMSKGPVGFIALVAGLVAVAATDGPRALGRVRLLAGLLVLGVLLAPWYLTYLAADRESFVGNVLIGHYGAWVSRRGVLPRLESLWVLAYFLPWTIFLATAAPWWRRVPDAERRLVGVWTLTLWALIGLSGLHRARYLIPIYPGLALLVGEFLARAGERGGEAFARRATLGLTAFVGVVAAVALSPLPHALGGEGRPWVPDSPAELAFLVVAVVAAAAAAAILAHRRAVLAAGVVVAIGMGGALIDEGVRYPARFARDFDVRPIAAAARALTPPDGQVAVYPDVWLTYDFYLHRRVVQLDRPAVERLLAGAARGALILSRKSWTTLEPAADRSWRIVAARRIADREILVLGGSGA